MLEIRTFSLERYNSVLRIKGMEQMPKRPPGLEKQGSIWRYRKVVPAELRDLVGRREIVVSLQTGDYQRALQKDRYLTLR